MKIISAAVLDPRREGHYRNPRLVVNVDEEIIETRAPITLTGSTVNWIVVPHGPFFAIDMQNKADLGQTQADMGVFNTAGVWESRLVDVLVVSPDHEYELSMGLDRARRLIRRSNLQWRFILDDVAGQHGKLLWRLQQHPLMCVDCTRPATTEVYYSGTHLALCPTHEAAHNRKVRHLRVSAASS